MAQLDGKAAGMIAGLGEHLGLREASPEERAAFEAKLSDAPRHCDDYIDDPAQPECLRRFLDYARLAPSLKYSTGDAAFDAAIEARLGHPMWRDPAPVLFARHEGRPVRVTMASRFGDVGISEDLDAERGYGRRVAVEELTDFSAERPEPRVVVKVAVDWNAPSWGCGNMGSPGGPAAVASHYRMLAEISAPETRGFEGNRAERRAAAARARKG